MLQCQRCFLLSSNGFDRIRNVVDLNSVPCCNCPLPNAVLGFFTRSAPFKASDALGSFEPIDSNKKLALSKELPPAIRIAVQGFDQALQDQKTLIGNINSDISGISRMLEKISADVTKRRPRAKLVQWHQGLVKIDTELRNSKCLYDDIKFGMKIAMYLSRHPQIYVRHIYFEKKIEVFRRQLEDIRCWIDNLDVQRAFKRRAASPSLSEIRKALQVQRSLLQRLAQKYALTKDRILLTERDAYGLVKNVIPYSQRFSMPRIPDSERVVSVFNPLDFERRPSDHVLVPKFILTQRDEAQRDAPSKLARGLFKLPKEDKLWRELAREAERRDEKARKKKLQAAEAERTADKVRNQKGPRRSKNQQAHFLDESS